MPSKNDRVRKLAAAVDVGLDAPICLACLSFVSMAIDDGDPRDIARQVRAMTPDLWAEGLADAALAAARRGAAAGDADAQAALEELEANGGRSAVAREIVERLGAELSARVHRDAALWRTMTAAAERGGAPELN